MSNVKRDTSRFAHLEKFSLNFSSSSFVIRANLPPSLIILDLLWINIVPLVFFNLSKVLFSGFPQFKGNLITP